MQLVDVQIHGFRRFGDASPHKLLVDGKLTCLIGANEAGKSSVLDLLSQGHSDPPIPQTDRTRREGVSDDRLVLRMRYRLDDDERERVADSYAAGGAPTWFIVEKAAGGEIRYGLEPRPRRDRRPRSLARIALVDAAEAARDTGNEALADLNSDELMSLEADLADDRETLDAEVLTHAEGVAGALASVGLLEAAEVVNDTVAFERLAHPHHDARRALWGMSPDFVTFHATERELSSEYDLQAVVASGAVGGLRNLASLAGLDLVELLNAIHAGETGTVQHLTDLANQRLQEIFAAWTQRPPLRVSFDTSGTTLMIHVASGTDTPMRFHERSEGLQQFVALVAATARRERDVPPILLIDEIETHLHYDAQADLLRVLARQDAVGQVIYTTHSAGSLPDDLGSVRVIEADPQRTRSRIRQHFWTDQPGLGPLLMALGAATLAFVPRRPALVAEGPSDLILLPTLLQQALNADDLGYQVAPGSSQVRPGSIIGFDLQAPRTAWIVDGDDGGAAIRDKLVADGIATDAIIVVGGEGSGLAIEDLIDRTVYIEAARAYFVDVGVDEEIAQETIQDGSRHADLETWASEHGVTPPSKVAIANRLLGMRATHRLVADDAVDVLRTVHEAARVRLAAGDG